MQNNNRPPDLYLPVDEYFRHKFNLTSDHIQIWGMGFYDLLSLKNPDGLMNGESIANIISRLAPLVSHPRALSESEYQTVLHGIWIATYGDRLDVTVDCSNCGEHVDFEMDLIQSLNEIERDNTPTSVIDDITFEFQEPSFNDLIAYRTHSYSLAKAMASVSRDVNQQVDIKTLHEYLREYQASDLAIKAKRIRKISYQNDEYEHPKDVLEILKNLNKNVYRDLDRVVKRGAFNKPVKVKCGECGHVNNTSVNLDPSTHFYQRLIETPDDNIPKLFEAFEKQSQEIHNTAMKLLWHMRGGVSLTEIMHMSESQRQGIEKVINDNFELSKKAKTPIL